MRAYVYTDKSLERYAGRFVWLSVNTESPKNAAFLKQYPIPALPTLLVLDPNGKVTLRYVGGATVPQLKKMLDDASTRLVAESDKLLAEADRLAAEGKHADAVKVYEKAFAKADKNWKKFGRAAESMIFSMAMADDSERCAARALELYPRVKGTASAANVAATGLGCAASLAETNPKREQWAAFLEGEAAKAKTAEQRAVYDSHRLTAYLALKTPEKAIPMLEQSERDFPKDYNPPARLAVAYRAMGKYDDALAASARALARAYGPRKIGIYRNRADIFTLKGDKENARKTIEEAIRYAEGLPKEQRSDATIDAMKKKLASFS